jgi:hypothetical protein
MCSQSLEHCFFLKPLIVLFLFLSVHLFLTYVLYHEPLPCCRGRPISRELHAFRLQRTSHGIFVFLAQIRLN